MVFSESCGGASNSFAKLSTILRDLQLTWDLHYKSTIMESESYATLDLIDDTKHNDF